MKELLRLVECFIERETGLKVLLDPQPIKIAEPHIRLTFSGTENWGLRGKRLLFQISILGAGDGPEAFIEKAIIATLKLDDLYDACNGGTSKTLKYNNNCIAVGFVNVADATASLTQNENRIVETGQWSYVYTATRYLGITIPDSIWKGEINEG